VSFGVGKLYLIKKTDPSDTPGMYSGRIFYSHIAPIIIALLLIMKKTYSEVP
jgi:hypothetical protein